MFKLSDEDGPKCKMIIKIAKIKNITRSSWSASRRANQDYDSIMNVCNN